MRPMCVGVFGPSQAGKSYLISALARRGTERVRALFDTRDSISSPTSTPRAARNRPAWSPASPSATRWRPRRGCRWRCGSCRRPTSSRSSATPTSPISIAARTSSCRSRPCTSVSPSCAARGQAPARHADRGRRLRPAGIFRAPLQGRADDQDARHVLLGAGGAARAAARRADRGAALRADLGRHRALHPALSPARSTRSPQLDFADEAFCPLDALMPRESQHHSTSQTLSRLGEKPRQSSAERHARRRSARPTSPALTAELRSSLEDKPWDFFDADRPARLPGRARSRENIQGPAGYLENRDKPSRASFCAARSPTCSSATAPSRS